jgi:polysaccharide export outer membrane protein
MTFRRLNVFLSLVAAIWLGCSAFGADTPEPASTASKTPAKEDYVIQPSDLLQVQVFQEDDLTRQVRVTQGGAISLPLIGSVSLKDLTIKQAQERIHDLYDADYLVNPQVTVSVLEYAKRNVNVIGAVNTPGAVPFPQEEGLNLLDAIARAGGFNRFADRKKIKLSRLDADGHTQTFIINADDLMESGNTTSWPLKRDDVIFVPERIL